MRRIAICIAWMCALAFNAQAQEQPIKFIADTLVVQASGTYEADPDLATLSFDISTQDKALAQAYSKATEAMQQIVTVAQKNGLKKEEISTGVLTLTPSYDLDRNKKPKQYYVHGEIDLKVHDFSKIGPILDDSLQGGLADFRSLTYTLENEEAAKEHAVADAMHNAVERAKAALVANNQKAGAVRYASVDVQQLVGVSQYNVAQLGAVSESIEVSSRGRAAATPPPPPPVQPAKITVTATVQCAFQIQ